MLIDELIVRWGNMRELKFRVWVKEHKRFVYSDDRVDDIFVRLNNFFDNVDWLRGKLNHPNKLYLQQYTGLKDKNGTEIWEGDIIEMEYPINCSHKEVVKFEYGYFWPFNIDGFQYESVKVLGNIYENQELLNENI